MAVCQEHSELVREQGELKGILTSVKEGMEAQGKIIGQIYEKINTDAEKAAEFKGGLKGGIAVIMAVASLAGAIGAFIEHSLK